MLKLSSFAEERNIDKDTISQYIRRHPEMFDGHTKIEGKIMYLDDAAVGLLEEKYPLPKPIQIIEDVETIKELAETSKQLAKAREMIIVLQNELMSKQEEISDLRGTVAKIEAKEVLLTDKQNQIEELKAERAENKETLESMQREIDRLKNRGLIERLLNK